MVEKISVMYDFREGGYVQSTGRQKVTTSHEEQVSMLMIFSAFLDVRTCKNWAYKIF